MTPSWFGGKTLDERKNEARSMARKMVRGVLQTGDEQGFIACVKLLRPGITDDELKGFLKLFRDLVLVQRR
jgi:hypothetical protein